MVEQAEIIGLVRTILIIVVIYWSFKLFSRYVFPYVVKYLFSYLGKKVQKNMQQNGFHSAGSNSARETQTSDNVFVKKTSQKKTSNSNLDGVGEYVDFEEVN